jgi:Domain of unknown function (DUF6901)
MDTTEITYKYCFDFPSGTKKRFLIQLDAKTLLLKSTVHGRPDWTHLGYHQCSCCSLDNNTTDYCPIAVNISELVTAFKDIVSHEACNVSCITTERTVMKNTLVQDGLSSIMGIIMATSGCPTMDILKPMARFHLPFATVDEAMFRSISVYLLRQYFLYQQGKTCDFFLKNVKTYYQEIEKVNKGMLDRIKHASCLDADRNAIVILNALAQILNMEIDDDLRSLRCLFFPDSEDAPAA